MKNNRKIIGLFILYLFIAVSVIFILTRTDSGAEIDKAPFEGEDPNGIQEVIVSNGEELLLAVNGVNSFSFIASDLYLFANTAYPEYIENSERPIGFRINTMEKSEEKIVLTGRFGATKNEVLVTIKPALKGRVTLSITDTATKLNIDNFLKSNSTKNQLIGQLPFDGEGFTINYVEDIDTFTVNVFNNPNNYNVAVNQLKEALGDDLFARQKLVRYGAGDKPFDNGF